MEIQRLTIKEVLIKFPKKSPDIKKLPHLATREKKMKEIMIENLKNAMDYCI